MLPPNIDLMTEISNRYYQERFEAAHNSRLLRKAGITRESRIARISLGLFVSLGHLLVALGHRLERLELEPPHQRLGDRLYSDRKKIVASRTWKDVHPTKLEKILLMLAFVLLFCGAFVEARGIIQETLR